MSVLKHQEVRCFCPRRQLLGIYVTGVDEDIQPYFHIKSYKGGTLYTEVKIFDGMFRVCCRNCTRWHLVKLLNGSFKIEQVPEFPRMVDATQGDAVTSAPR